MKATNFIELLFRFFPIIIVSLLITSCEDPIEVELEEGKILLVVDGWITDQQGPHKIILSTTSPYFDNRNTPRKSGAEITISDDLGNTEFLTETSPGLYITRSDYKGVVGRQYFLTIEVDDQIFEAETEIRRPAVIDSLSSIFKEKSLMNKEGYYIEYNGPEAEGIGDSYRFKIYKNGQLLNKPENLIVVQDRLTDGAYFKNVQFHSEPFEVSDKVTVEVCSITEDAYFFYSEMRDQISNGGMFADPVANIRTNIKSMPGNGLQAVGYFGGASVVSKEVVIE